MNHAADPIVSIHYEPGQNCNLLQYSILRIRVRVSLRDMAPPGRFRVAIRTNLNQAQRIRRQVIDQVEKGQSYSTDYYDLPTRYEPGRDEYQADVLLSEVGYFEFKPRVESTEPDRPWVKWAQGQNIGVSVAPLEYRKDNSIYCAFIRQFGPDKHKPSLKDAALEQTIHQLEEQGAFVLPAGGNFETFIEQLPFIIETMGMKIIHLLPINPVPTSYGRMGMYGSPYATTDYFGIDHTYAGFSRFKTIEDQFIDLTSTVHGLGAKVFLDMVINHAGWASSILFKHRQWIKTGPGPERQILSPGAWGVVWGDLVELDYRHQDLWEYMADVFRVWCRRGIDGFRLDAGYMIPIEVWRYIIAKVRQEFPDTLFLLEGLGGPLETTEKLLTEGQNNWAYSELFQNYTREQISHYLRYAREVSAGKGVLVHYAETHDNDRLAKKGKIYTRMRLYLCAFTSFRGAWGFTNGVEWLATEKIDVHRNAGLNWGSEDNLVQEISTINRILSENPAFWGCDHLDLFQAGHPEVLAFHRSSPEGSNRIFCLINLNTEQPRDYQWDIASFPKDTTPDPNPDPTDVPVLHELISDQSQPLYEQTRIQGQMQPGQCLLYRLEKQGQPYRPFVPAIQDMDPDKIALTYKILLSRFEPHEVGQLHQERILRDVYDFRRFVALVNTTSIKKLAQLDLTESLEAIDPAAIEQYSAVWTFRESKKEFILSGDQWLVTHTFVPCTAYLKTSRGTLCMESIPTSDGLGHFTFFPPQEANEHAMLTFNWKIHRDKKCIRQQQEEEYLILSLPSARKKTRTRKIYPIVLDKNAMRKQFATVLLTDGRGAVSQCPARPGVLYSKYDSFLSVVEPGGCPAERISLVNSLKETVQIGRKFFDLDDSFLHRFTRYPWPMWEFVYDDGQYYLTLERSMIMPYETGGIWVRYKLRLANTAITLFSKCHLECRGIHDQVQAVNEEKMQERLANACSVHTDHQGFDFQAREDMPLRVRANHPAFIHQPHWIHDLDFPLDAQRGLEPKGDAFAPGGFQFELQPGSSVELSFSTKEKEKTGCKSFHAANLIENKHGKELLAKIPSGSARNDPLVKMLAMAMDQFLVQNPRGRWSMLSGYPWLGVYVSDMLHSIGGLLAAGRAEAAEDLILQAAATELQGLLCDWLHDPRQARTGIEASLRLILAAQQYGLYTQDNSFWKKPIDPPDQSRALREVIGDIYQAFRSNTGKDSHPKQPNGPLLDEQSGLLYCPAGTSWMNTRHPQATPRAGYPIEIQALWYRALEVIGRQIPSLTNETQSLRKNITDHFMSLYWNENRNYLADLLSADSFRPAEKTRADYALRFNQLAAINAALVPLEPARRVMNVLTRKLLIPAAVRSLSEEPLDIPLDIKDDQGRTLLDPRMPYRPSCKGDETARRLAYHNGSAWLSAYPDFIEAQASVFHFTPAAVKHALAFFEPIREHLTEAGIGTLSQLKDGDVPHEPRECYAYGLAVAETLRVYMQLKYQKQHRREQNQPAHSNKSLHSLQAAQKTE